MLQDLRHAVRALSSSLGFAAATVSCLALGIGVNVAAFAILDALLLAPPPFPDPERLVVLGEALRDSPSAVERVSYPNVRDWQESAGDVVEIAALQPGRVRLDEGQRDDPDAAARVTPNLLALLGIRPLAGRGFAAGEDEPGAQPVVMLSEPLWRQRFGEDANIIGRTVAVDGALHTVIGIVPALRDWAVPAAIGDARLWLPLTPREADRARDRRTLAVFARLLPGVMREAAVGRLESTAAALEARYAENAGRVIAISPILRELSPVTRAMLALGFGGAVIVLLIACANAANLTLARSLTRRREVAVRTALGASRLRIVRQLLTESLVLGALAAPLGVLLAAFGLEAISRGLPALGANIAFSIGPRALAFTVALVLAILMLSGLAPALQALRGATRDALGDTAQAVTAGRRHKRMQHVLVVGEVAMSLVLLVAASLLIRSFWNLLHEETVLDPTPLTTLRVELPDGRNASSAAIASRVTALVEHAASAPGVAAASASDLVPLSGGGRSATLLFDDTQSGTLGTAVVRYGGVAANFFETLDVPLVRGRAFADGEADTRSAVAVVNERIVQRVWRGEDPLGKRIRIAEDLGGEWFTVIGVVPSLPNWSVSGVPSPTVYVPYPYVADPNPLVIVRASGDSAVTASAARAAIETADPALVVGDVEPLTALHEDLFWRQSLFGNTFVVLAVIAVLLAATGLYGVLSHLVAQRTREIGLRVALGAGRGDVLGLVLRRGMLLVAAGVVIGTFGALGLTRAIGSVLYGVSAGDPVHFAAAALLLLGVGVAASGAPARRAAVADPIASLRD